MSQEPFSVAELNFVMTTNRAACGVTSGMAFIGEHQPHALRVLLNSGYCTRRMFLLAFSDMDYL
jgi:hypothetical protein